MKGVESFIFVFIAAIIVLLVLIFALGMQPLQPPVTIPTSIKNFSKIGLVGYTQSYVSRTEDLGSFSVGKTQTFESKSIPRLDISSGSFFGLLGLGYEKFKINIPQEILEQLKRVKITFDVNETNLYGDLIIRWNGKNVFSSKANINPYTVYVGSDYVKGENEVEISCGGTGLMFWASTVYVLKEFNIKAEYGPIKFIFFNLTKDELESLDKIELSFYTAARLGNLTIKINGGEIYKGSPERMQSINFSSLDAPLNLGKNILTFIAADGSFELQDASLKVFMLSYKKEVRKSFDLSEEQYNELETSKGKIEFNLKRILKSGKLEIKLNDKDLKVTSVATGWNIIYFDSEQAIKGKNWLTFSGTGSFDIGEVRIGLKK